MNTDDDGFVPLFNGEDFTGWFATPRTYGALWPGGPDRRLTIVPGWLPDDYDERAEAHQAVWTVEDGAIVGRHAWPGAGYGGYLQTDAEYSDFELRFEVRPDWPADTGVHLRQLSRTFHGIHVVIDHREAGSIGGFWGSGIGAFHAVPFAFSAVTDEHRRAVDLQLDDPATSRQPGIRRRGSC